MPDKLTPQDFVYDLPDGLIAQQPAVTARDACRLMHLDRDSGRTADGSFGDLPGLLRRGDLLVLNDTRVVPAKFSGRRVTGGRIEGLFLRELADGAWSVLLNRAGRCKVGERIELDGRTRLELLVRHGEGRWTVRPEPPASAEELLGRLGRTPLPPYIHRTASSDDGADRAAYQTVFARTAGAVAAPTAGLHFTDGLLADLEAAGVERTFVTLHVGLGTFAPVKAETLAGHQMHSEWYELSAAAVEAIAAARARGGRIVAVGTTAVRVLEAAARRPGSPGAHSGWTDIFLYPPADFRATDALITNFHLPRSTLLMLVAAFCSPGKTDGLETTLAAYRRAIEGGYRFYSYGDAMLID